MQLLTSFAVTFVATLLATALAALGVTYRKDITTGIHRVAAALWRAAVFPFKFMWNNLQKSVTANHTHEMERLEQRLDSQESIVRSIQRRLDAVRDTETQKAEEKE
ncbi:MAG: hypothetical protein IH957_04870 [Chloroflexi bacterium]|nr:hypothetical protein [Chloroflexota bacterium]